MSLLTVGKQHPGAQLALRAGRVFTETPLWGAWRAEGWPSAESETVVRANNCELQGVQK